MRSRLLVALLALSASACVAHLKRPAVEFQSAEVKAVDVEGATILCRLDVENPNSVELSVVRLSWQLSVRGRQVAEGSLPELARLPANGRATVALPARVRFGDLPGVMSLLFSGEEIAYELKGVAGVDSPVGVLDLPFAHSGNLARP
jgi:LEA14-like dessication related protein